VVSAERVSTKNLPSFTSTAYTPSNPCSFVPLPKSATPSRIHSNAAVYDFALGNEDLEKLNALDLGKAGAISWNPIDAE